MRSSFLLPILLSASLPGEEPDRLTLGNGDLFIGKVLSLDDRLIQLQSPHSETPLKILNENLVELRFAGPADSGSTADLPVNSQELFLENGDQFPGELIALDDKVITFQTWFTGDLVVKRPQIKSLLFGVTPQKPVYRGPRDIEEWDLENDRNWTVSDGSLVARQRSTIGRNFGLPINFAFRSRISWENSPNCRIHLCAMRTTTENNHAGDSYLVSLGSTGIQVQRVLVNADGDPVYQRLFNDEISLRSRTAKSVEVEILVDRESRRISLFLDGNKVGQGLDPNEPPAGSCAIFESLDHANGDMIVRDIEVNEWDTRTQALRLEPRAADDLDTLSVAEGDRFSGSITTYDPTEGSQSFAIETELDPEPLVIPLRHCAVMYFAREEGTTFPQCRYRINLVSGGHLTVSQIKLGPDTLTATHPWLGMLKIDRRAMKSITKS